MNSWWTEHMAVELIMQNATFTRNVSYTRVGLDMNSVYRAKVVMLWGTIMCLATYGRQHSIYLYYAGSVCRDVRNENSSWIFGPKSPKARPNNA